MSKHTKGEWMADGAFVYCLNNHHEKSNRFNLSICKGYDDNKKWISAEEAEANARLIAAAPELLEALKMLYVASYDNLPMRDFALILAEAWNAIKKAEGGEG